MALVREPTLIIGYSSCGKTTAADILASPGKSISTSDALIDDFTKCAGLEHPPTREEILANKDKWRDALWAWGRELQKDDPLAVVRRALFKSPIVTGVRNPDEIEAIRKVRLFRSIIWIDRPGCYPGKTDLLTSRDADVIVTNDGSITDLRYNLIEAIIKWQRRPISCETGQ